MGFFFHESGMLDNAEYCEKWDWSCYRDNSAVSYVLGSLIGITLQKNTFRKTFSKKNLEEKF